MCIWLTTENTDDVISSKHSPDIRNRLGRSLQEWPKCKRRRTIETVKQIVKKCWQRKT